MTTPRSAKSQKSSKSTVSAKDKPDLEYNCKFRGKYDLSKNKKNQELSVKNVIDIFEVISKKNANLFKNTIIKMYKDKQSFLFEDQKFFSKHHHHILYSQIKKFFVLSKDPCVVILGVLHKNHRWFLAFQFQNPRDLKEFCDEIEGLKKKEVSKDLLEDDFDLTSLKFPKPLVDDSNKPESSNHLKRISIPSDMYNANLEVADNNFNDIYFEPDLEVENVFPESSLVEEASLILCTSKPSSRNSMESEANEKFYCDNISNTKPKDMLKSCLNLFEDNDNEWAEELTCMDYPTAFNKPKLNKRGPVYIYSARHKVNCEEYMFQTHSAPESSDEDDNDSFIHCKAKFIKKGNIPETFQNLEPKLIKTENRSNNFSNHDSKMNYEKSEMNNFYNLKPKMIQRDKKTNQFQNYDPKMIETNYDSETFHNHEPKWSQDNDDIEKFNNHDSKLIMKPNRTSDFYNCDPKLIHLDKEPEERFQNLEPKMIRKDDSTETFHNHDPKVIQVMVNSEEYYNHEPKMIY